MKLCVASVALSNMHPKVALGLSSNLFNLGKTLPDTEVIQMLPERFEIATARNVCIEYALNHDCDMFFWLDDDTILLTPDVLTTLVQTMERRTDIHMLCPAYYVRSYPFKQMAFVATGEYSMTLMGEDQEQELVDEHGIIDSLRAIGNGCTLMRMEIFKKMTVACSSQEWYRTGKYNTEDAYFCAKVRTVIPEFNCGVDMNVTAAHLIGHDWVDRDNVEYKRMKYRMVHALHAHPEMLTELNELVNQYLPKGDLSKIAYPSGIDASLGRM